MKKTFKIIGCTFAVLLFLFGAFIYCYPFINGYLVGKNSEETIRQFHDLKKIVENQKTPASSTQTCSDEDDNPIGSTQNFNKLYEDMQKYNRNIYVNGQKDLKDAWSYEQSAFDLTTYGIYNGVTAELIIPKMNVDLPIYLGATWGNMGIGATQLGQTSMPIGGNNTNCVIAGHRGCSAGRFFLDIEMLEIGDKVYIDNLWETLTYQVDKIEIIDPYDIDKIFIKKNKDMITLITCHPYPYNYQRYVVYCVRCPNDDTSQSDSAYESSSGNSASEKGTQLHGQNSVKNDGNSQLFIIFESCLCILVPAALLVLAVCLFKSRKR